MAIQRASVALLALFVLLTLACSSGSKGRLEASPNPSESTASPSQQAAELRRITYPEFQTWQALQDYIVARHERIASFADREPVTILSAGVTFERGLRRTEAEAVIGEYGIALNSAEYRAAGNYGGGAAFAEGALATVEAGAPFNDGSFRVTYIFGQAKAADLARLSADERIALVYADHSLDRLAGVVPTQVLFMQPPSIFDVYQRLKPTH